jgi:hypothetical protein
MTIPSRSTISGETPYLLTSMATIYCKSTTVIVTKREDLELFSVERQLTSYQREGATKAVLQSNNRQEVNQLANNLSATLSSTAIVTKSIPSWTITQIVQGVLSANVKN